MKKIILSLLLTGFLVIPAVGLAAEPITTMQTAPNLNVMLALDNIVNWLFTILLVVAAIFIVVAAFYFVTASGAPEKVEMARNFVLYALVGVLVAFLAKGLIYLVRIISGAGA